MAAANPQVLPTISAKGHGIVEDFMGVLGGEIMEEVKSAQMASRGGAVPLPLKHDDPAIQSLVIQSLLTGPNAGRYTAFIALNGPGTQKTALYLGKLVCTYEYNTLRGIQSAPGRAVRTATRRQQRLQAAALANNQNSLALPPAPTPAPAGVAIFPNHGVIPVAQPAIQPGPTKIIKFYFLAANDPTDKSNKYSLAEMRRMNIPGMFNEFARLSGCYPTHIPGHLPDLYLSCGFAGFHREFDWDERMSDKSWNDILDIIERGFHAEWSAYGALFGRFYCFVRKHEY